MNRHAATGSDLVPSRARERRVEHVAEERLNWLSEQLIFLADELAATWALDPDAGPLRCPLHDGQDVVFDGADLASRAACPACFLGRVALISDGCKSPSVPQDRRINRNRSTRGAHPMGRTTVAQLGVAEIAGMLGLTVTDDAIRRLRSSEHQGVLAIGHRLLIERDLLIEMLDLRADVRAAELERTVQMRGLLYDQVTVTERILAAELERDRPGREREEKEGRARYEAMVAARGDAAEVVF